MMIFRSFLFLILFYGLTILLVIISIPVLLMPASYTSKLGSLWGKILHFSLSVIPIRFSISGDSQKSKQVIYAVKHQSAWETIILYWQLGKPVVVLKKELLSIPIIGIFMKRAGCIAVDRNAGMRALKKLKEEAILASGSGRSILIYPQGTRVSISDKQRPYQIGIFSIYQALGLPVVPVALDSGRYWPNKKLLKKAGTIDVVFLSQIETGLTRKEFMADLEHMIETKCSELEKKET